MMIPPKLTHGDNLSNLFEKFNAVIDYLREIRLIAGNGIRLNRLAAGTTIESTATASGGSPSSAADLLYHGMFALSVEMEPDPDTGEDVINLNVKGGVAYINASRFDILAFSEPLGTDPVNYVYLSAEYDSSDSSFQNVEIGVYTEEQTDEEDVKYHLLGVVYYENQSYSVEQNQYGQIQMLFFGDCGEEDEETPVD